MNVQTNQNTQRDGLKKSVGPQMELETEKLRMKTIAAWAQDSDHLVTTKQNVGELWVCLGILELQTRCIRQGSCSVTNHGRSWPSDRVWSDGLSLGWGHVSMHK